jgi:HlyD family secretion protein
MKKCAGLLGLLGLVGLLGLWRLPFVAAVGDEGAKEKPKTSFRTEAVKKGTLAGTLQATGTLEPEEVIDVAAQVQGQIVKFGADPADPKKTVDYNTLVDKGTLLVQIDPAIYETEVEDAQANQERTAAEFKLAEAKLHQAEKELARELKLQEKKTLGPEEVEVKRAEVEAAKTGVEVKKAALKQAQASLKKAQINLDRTSIRSPVKGVVIDRRVNFGQNVSTSLSAPSIFLIARDLTKMQVWVSVPEASIGYIKQGQAVTFTIDTYPNETFKGEVSKIRLSRIMAQRAVTYIVEVRTDNPTDKDYPYGKLMPYLTANVRFKVPERKNVLMVPDAALRWQPQPDQVAPEYLSTFHRLQMAKIESLIPADLITIPLRWVVWVEDKGYVRPVLIRPGSSDGTFTEVLAGDIEEGQKVIVGEEKGTPKRD